MMHAWPADAAILDSILAVVRERTGMDFSRYRPATVQRRIANRMISVGVRSLEAYLSLLVSSRDEAQHLLNRLSIKVSRFYRNRVAFEVLRSVLPALARRAPDGLRMWSAGCGCGEEPYTLAMLLEERGLAGSVVATDIDPAALQAAGQGAYAEEAAAELPRELAARFLVRAGRCPPRRSAVAVTPAVRSRVRFSRMDLLAGAQPAGGPFHVVCCRNVLIYLQPDARNVAFATLRRALAPGGVLFLGEAEWPPEELAAGLSCLGRSRVFILSREAEAAQ